MQAEYHLGEGKGPVAQILSMAKKLEKVGGSKLKFGNTIISN